jgi:diguanylate cyclase (GGDEF)-like protein
MSFRTRLTGFFVLIVVVPMLALGVLVFTLISDSEQGKADARASGLAVAAASLYNSASADAQAEARTLGRAIAVLPAREVAHRVAALAAQAGIARVTVAAGPRTLVGIGSQTAIAPGTAIVEPAGNRARLLVAVSELTAAQFAHELSPRGVAIVVSQGDRTLASTLPAVAGQSIPAQGDTTVGGVNYRVVTQTFPGFGHIPVRVQLLSDRAATASSVGTSELVAAAFILGFLVLAFAFAVMASRALQGQLGRFLSAARRLGSGDFSSPVPVEGHDEFAALGDEFNSMSEQLATRLDELNSERAKLRESLRRIGQTFASNLDRPALLELALSTAVDGAEASYGRLSVRSRAHDPLEEAAAVGSFAGLEAVVRDAEQRALNDGATGEAAADDAFAVSVALGQIEASGRSHGQITVARADRAFTDDDREMLRSLASQTTLALENVELHHQVQRQAITDELTGLANHGRFQDLLSIEVEEVRRYHYPVGLIMVDIDDFKSVNDTFGHQQGDIVLKQVARVLRESSREPDTPARYGGEEMALILPHTDLVGSHAIAERVRTAIESLRIPRLDQQGVLRITASLGVSATVDGDKDTLISEADAALYAAKRGGKNRTITAPERVQTANLYGGQ